VPNHMLDLTSLGRGERGCAHGRAVADVSERLGSSAAGKREIPSFAMLASIAVTRQTYGQD
jgi:hypothetical protein